MTDAKPTDAPATTTKEPTAPPSAAPSQDAPAASVPPAEAAGATPAAEKPKPPPAAKDWAKIASEEKRIRAERAKLDAERRAISEAAKSRAAREELETKAKAGDAEAQDKLLAGYGITYDQLTRRALNRGKVDKGAAALEKLEKLEADLQKREEDAKRAAEESATQAQETELARQIDGFCGYVSKEAAAEYPLLSGEVEENRGYVEATIRHMVRVHAEAIAKGDLPPETPPLIAGDVAKRLEAHLLAETNRRMARLRPAPPTADPKTSTETSPRDEQGRAANADGPRRLTNGLSAERTTPAGSRPKAKTPFERDREERERIQRAANAFSPRR
jgi:hypothetical protein